MLHVAAKGSYKKQYSHFFETDWKIYSKRMQNLQRFVVVAALCGEGNVVGLLLNQPVISLPCLDCSLNGFTHASQS